VLSGKGHWKELITGLEESYRAWCVLRVIGKTHKGSLGPTGGRWAMRKRGIYSRVLFCDGSFYCDSLLRNLSSRTEHSRLVLHHCRNSSVLSVLSALLALFQCPCVSSFSILVRFV